MSETRKTLRTLALVCGLAILASLPALAQDKAAQDKAAEEKANALKVQADEAIGRKEAAKKILDVVQANAKPFRDALAKLKADEAKAASTVQTSEKDLPAKTEAAKKAAADQPALDKAAADTAAVAKVATDAKATADKLAAELAALAKSAGENAAKAKEAAEKDPNNKELAAAKAAADKAVVDVAALVKDATANAPVIAKAQTDTAAVAKTAADKAAAGAKAVADTAAAVKATEVAISTSKEILAKAPEAIKAAEANLARLQPAIDQVIAAHAAVATESVDKLRLAQSALTDAGKFVIFSKQVAPIFAKRCLACHNARIAKGRYNMETYAGVMKGGEQGDTVIPNDGDLSNLCLLIEDGGMPKDADPLSKDEIALIKKWVATGAVLDAGFEPDQPLVNIMPKLPQPMPPDTYRVPVPITALAFSPDGSQLASSGYHEVVIWNAADKSQIRRITNLAERTYDVQYSPDGQLIAVAAGTPAQMGEVKLFKAADGTLVRDLVTTSDAMFAVSFSPDGKRLAAAGADRAIRVFDVATGKQELMIEDHADWVMGIAWSPDGAKLASASRDKTSKVFDAKTGDSIITFPGHAEPVYGVAFSPNGQEVATSGRDKQIRIWNAADAKQVRVIGGFGNEVYRIVVTPDNRVFSSSADMTAREHKFDNVAAIRTFTGHKDWVYTVAFNPGTKKLATGSWDGEIRIWNAEDAKGMLDFVAAPGYKAPAAQ